MPRWGFAAHREIAEKCVLPLPLEIRKFYKSHISEFSQAVIQPDIRRYSLAEEKPRHYIDLDDYGPESLRALRAGWDSTQLVIDEDTLMELGILPLAIVETKVMLTRAMQEKDHAKIIRFSADLVHYISDAHVPLHTTGNYDGQRTGQKGIHSLWESRIPEIEMSRYDIWFTKPEYISHVSSWTWAIINNSHSKVDSILSIEKHLSSSISEDRKYTHGKRGKSVQRIVSEEYAIRYSSQLNGMIERQFNASILACSSILFTCWVDAGQPVFDDLDNKPEREIDPKVDIDSDHHK